MINFYLNFVWGKFVHQRTIEVPARPLLIPEILLKVMSYLTPRDLGNTLNVNRLWRSCSIVAAKRSLPRTAHLVNQTILAHLSRCDYEARLLGMCLEEIYTGWVILPEEEADIPLFQPLELTFHEYDRITDPLHFLIRRFGPYLTTIDFSSLETIVTDVTDRANKTRCADIKTIALHLKKGHYSVIDNRLIEIIAKYCPHLLDLRLDHGAVNDLAIPHLQSMQTLRTLSLKDCPLFPSIKIAALSYQDPIDLLIVNARQMKRALQLGGNEEVLYCSNKRRKHI